MIVLLTNAQCQLKWLCNFALAVLLLWSFGCALPTATAAATELVFNNPLMQQRADPQVFLHSDGYYYFTATVPEYDRIELRRSKSLNDLGKATAQVIWRKHDSGPMSHHIWAPELHFIDGKWYLYFTAGKAEAIWDIRLYILENSSPNPLQGEWIERGQLKTGWESFSLDATTFIHHAQRYLVWTQRGPHIENKATNIYIAKMDTPLSITGAATLISKPEYDWEKIKHQVNEAPAVLIKNQKIFITYSASATDVNYCLGLLTANANADLLDAKSWQKSLTPVFKSSEKNGQFGPGHNSFTTTADGQTTILLYHARNYREIKGDPLKDPNRHTRAQVLHWHADGTPDFAEPVADKN